MGEDGATRCGLVAIAGAPNVGKSTLLNRILGRHLSIATSKPQTTRTRVLGIETRGDVQMIFTDTPGIHEPRGLLHERMVDHARSGLRGADLTLWLLAADRGLGRTDRAELPQLAQEGGRQDGRAVIVVINKMDLLPRQDLLPLMAAVGELLPEASCVPASAKSGENVERLVDEIATRIPAGPWLYPADALSDQPARFFAAELVREQLFLQLQ